MFLFEMNLVYLFLLLVDGQHCWRLVFAEFVLGDDFVGGRMRGLAFGDAKPRHGSIECHSDIGRFFDNSIVLVPSDDNGLVGNFQGRDKVDGFSFFDYLEKSFELDSTVS